MGFLFVCLFIFCKTCILLGPDFLKRHGTNVAVFASLNSLWGHKFCQQSSGRKYHFMSAFAFKKSSDTVDFVQFVYLKAYKNNNDTA